MTPSHGGGRCAACNSVLRPEIDRRLAAGESTRIVAAWLATQGERMHFGLLARHKKAHGGSDSATSGGIVAGIATDTQRVASTGSESAAGELELLLDRLNERQRRFVMEYMVDGNATQAAARAGYAFKSAYQEGYRLLRNADVAAAIAMARADLLERQKVTVERVTAEMANVAFTSMKQVARWGPKGLRLLPSSQLSPEAAAAVQVVTEKRTEHTDKDGNTTVRTTLTVRLHDKGGACEKLMRHLGMFVDRVEVDKDTEFVIRWNDDEKEQQEAFMKGAHDLLGLIPLRSPDEKAR